MADIRILCGTFHLSSPDRWPDRGCVEGRPARPHLEVLHIPPSNLKGWTSGAGKRTHRIERRSIGEWSRRKKRIRGRRRSEVILAV